MWSVIVAAALGAVTSAVLGWLDSGQTFNPRKFTYSAVYAVIAAIEGAATLPDGTVAGLIAAFLAGAGVDALGNRIKGAINAAVKPPSPPSP